MESNTKRKQETISIKDALSNVSGIQISESKGKKKDWRDAIWNYPLFLRNLFVKTIPFSYILFFLIISSLFALFLQSRYFGTLLKTISYTQDTYTEGLVGAHSSFNPLFVSTNYIDRSIDSLIFQKFVYIDTDDKPEPGVAKSWTISADSLVYTFTIDEGLHWQDGSPVTMDDVMFTFDTAISLSKNTTYDSVGAALEGVTINKIDDKTIAFTLPDANPTFFEAVSVYIVPKSQLENVDLQNIYFSFLDDPVGSGKYMVEKTEQNAVYLTDNPYDNYNPHIKQIVFKIYPDYSSLENGLRVGAIDALSSTDNQALSFMSDYPSFTSIGEVQKYMERILFFNVRKDDLKDSNVRVGLSYLLDKSSLLKESDIAGTVMTGPYSSDSWAFNNSIDYYDYNPASAITYLSDAGFTKNAETGYFESKDGKILSFVLTYLGNDLNDRFVNALVKLYDKEGVIIEPRRLSYNEITQQVFPNRDFELLLYEVETTVDPDQYNLWHSQNVDYPKLNLSGYSNERMDILLEEARKTTNVTTRKTDYFQFEKYLMRDAPVIFLYNPTFTFYYNKDLKGIDLNDINFSYERYWNIQDWYWKK